MKGFKKDALSLEEFEKREYIFISLKKTHLEFWFLQPIPTHLALFIQSAEKFLVLNLQAYVQNQWGPEIFNLEQDNVTVRVPKDSVLDDQAFSLLLRKSKIESWKKVISTDKASLESCMRDYNLVWQLGTDRKRNVEHQVTFMDWITKTRSQLYIQERPRGDEGKWYQIRQHWQYMTTIEDLEVNRHSLFRSLRDSLTVIAVT